MTSFLTYFTGTLFTGLAIVLDCIGVFLLWNISKGYVTFFIAEWISK